MFLFQTLDEKVVKLSEFSLKLIRKKYGSRIIDILLQPPISAVYRSSDAKNFSGGKLSVVVEITDHIVPKYKNSAYKIIGLNNDEMITIVYFNYRAPYLRKLFPIGAKVLVSGDAKKNFDEIQIVHPDIVSTPNMLEHYVGFEPVYPLTAKLTNRTVKYVIESLIKKMPKLDEWIPERFLQKYELISFYDAICHLHHPKSLEEVFRMTPARKRLAIDELLANQIKLKQIRNQYDDAPAIVLKSNGALLDKLQLPFELTEDQKRCIDDIKNDLASKKQMNRLLQGDVGSGKTVVAFISMLIAIENGTQAAILAPTEILALQHFNTISKLSKSLPINIDLMLGSNRKHRQFQIQRLLSGETNILVCTHAALEDEIEFKNLGIVVIDEQHRFGVMQRIKFIKKCKYPNVLAMSATPIPRTLLLGCYGDLDVSSIKSKPSGRQPVNTTIINVSNVAELTNRLQKIDSQVYWVCPIIEESESLVDVTTRSNYLKNVFSENEVRVLHGKMNPKEKEQIITDFQQNKFKILVSTTVIEVGVDIPNANVIVIEHAERFGLAQLHQLRGRVGRSSEKSYCILLYHYPVTEVGKQRLQLLKNSDDGFYISEEDLKMRGSGDILGKEQSGFDILRFSDFASNYELIEIASKIADEIDVDSENSKLLCEIFDRIDNDVIA